MLDNVEIDIDTWPLINTFVEFEGEDEISIKKVISKLEMKYEESTTMDVHSIYLSLGYTDDDMKKLSFKESE